MSRAVLYINHLCMAVLCGFSYRDGFYVIAVVSGLLSVLFGMGYFTTRPRADDLR